MSENSLNEWWILVSEAVQRTGKGQSTIYRRCKSRKLNEHGKPIVLMSELKEMWPHTNVDPQFSNEKALHSQNSQTGTNQEPNYSHEKNALKTKLEAANEQLKMLKEQIEKNEKKAEEEIHYLRNELSNATTERQREQSIRASIESQRNEMQTLLTLMNDRAGKLGFRDGLKLLVGIKPKLALPAASFEDESSTNGEVIDAESEEVFEAEKA